MHEFRPQYGKKGTFMRFQVMLSPTRSFTWTTSFSSFYFWIFFFHCARPKPDNFCHKVVSFSFRSIDFFPPFFRFVIFLSVPLSCVRVFVSSTYIWSHFFFFCLYWVNRTTSVFFLNPLRLERRAWVGSCLRYYYSAVCLLICILQTFIFCESPVSTTTTTARVRPTVVAAQKATTTTVEVVIVSNDQVKAVHRRQTTMTTTSFWIF